MTAQRVRRTSLIAIVAAAIGLASAKVLIVSLQLSLSGQVVLIVLALMLASAATCAVSIALDHHAGDDGPARPGASAPRGRDAR